MCAAKYMKSLVSSPIAATFAMMRSASAVYKKPQYVPFLPCAWRQGDKSGRRSASLEA